MASQSRSFTVLGIETSCDETAAAVVRGRSPGPGTILSNLVYSQLDEHRPYGGVVPEIAARAHVEILDRIVQKALDQAEIALGDIDSIVATAGPGLIGGVMVGLTTAKALAVAADKPFIGINHLEAHALTARLTSGVGFPFLLLLVSGGHCQLLAAKDIGSYAVYGTTIDDAIGEAFDKAAKLLGLPYPGGPAIEAHARLGNPTRCALPRPMKGREGCDFSFSGLKTAVRQIVEKRESNGCDSADIAAGFQAAIVDVVVDRVRAAMRKYIADFPQSRLLVVAGGVAANTAIKDALARVCHAEGFALEIPPPRLCTDNAAMVAWAGVERSACGAYSNLDMSPKARWPLREVTVGGA